MRRAVALLLATAVLGGCSLGDEDTNPPPVGVESDDEQAAEQLGFPSSATRNTIRVGGSDPAADAAGVASALFPATGSSDRPTAVVLVDGEDWQSAVAASVLAGPPIAAPLLLSDGGELPAVTEDTLDRLAPRGSDLSKDAQVIRIGQEVARPEGFKTAVIQGSDAYAAPPRSTASSRPLAAGPSGDVVLYSGERARVGDARRRVGGAIRRRRPAGQGGLDSRRRGEGARRARAAERVPAGQRARSSPKGSPTS